jgi:hypothetical protein
MPSHNGTAKGEAMTTTDTLSLRERAKAAHREVVDSQTKYALARAERERVRRLKTFTQRLRELLGEDPSDLTREVYVVDGLQFHYVENLSRYGCDEYVALKTGECPKCHAIVLKRVDYLHEVGACLMKMEVGEISGLQDHDYLCPERGVEVVPTPQKIMPSSTE